MKKLFGLSILAGAMLYASPAAAGGYGPAGCGVGTMILGKKATGVMGGLAMYLNAAFWGPTSVTLGVFGCGKNNSVSVKVSKTDLKAKDFITANREQIIEDAAKKSPRSMKLIASVMQCQNEAAFVSSMQSQNPTMSMSNDELFARALVTRSAVCKL